MKPSKQLQFACGAIAFVVFGALLVGTFLGLCRSPYLPDWWVSACMMLGGLRVLPSLVLFALFIGTVAGLGGMCDACGMTKDESDRNEQ